LLWLLIPQKTPHPPPPPRLDATQGDDSSPRGASTARWQATSHRHGPAWFPCTGGHVLPVHATCPGGRPPATHPDTWRFWPMRWVQVDPASSLPFPCLSGTAASPGSSIQENPGRSTASAPLLLRSATLSASVAPIVVVALPPCLDSLRRAPSLDLASTCGASL
jgi:hypothetical protein